MSIVYKDTKQFAAEELERLFRSVGWMSAKYPGRLVKAMAGSDTVYTAWQGEILVGLINAIDDGELTVYYHYLLVDPACQGMKIGYELVRRMTEHYKDYLYQVLISEHRETAAFYEKCGFKAGTNNVPMSILNQHSENKK